jgi:hypothetical protein
MTKSDPDFDDFADHVRNELLPMMKKSAIVVSIVPLTKEGVDVKFAVELGISVMLDKPIVAVIQPGTEIPEKLSRVVDRFVELNMDDPASKQRVAEAIAEAARELGIDPS